MTFGRRDVRFDVVAAGSGKDKRQRKNASSMRRQGARHPYGMSRSGHRIHRVSLVEAQPFPRTDPATPGSRDLFALELVPDALHRAQEWPVGLQVFRQLI